MKVNVYVTEDVTDDERKQMSEVIGVKQASRDQMKEFLWRYGASWRSALSGVVPTPSTPEPELDDLI